MPGPVPSLFFTATPQQSYARNISPIHDTPFTVESRLFWDSDEFQYCEFYVRIGDGKRLCSSDTFMVDGTARREGGPITKGMGDNNGTGLSAGAKAGIAVGAVAAAVLLGGVGGYFLFRKWKRVRDLMAKGAAAEAAEAEARGEAKAPTTSEDSSPYTKQELGGTPLNTGLNPQELSGEREQGELEVKGGNR